MSDVYRVDLPFDRLGDISYGILVSRAAVLQCDRERSPQKAQKVTDAAPIASWMIGRKFDEIQLYIEAKGGKIVRCASRVRVDMTVT